MFKIKLVDFELASCHKITPVSVTEIWADLETGQYTNIDNATVFKYEQDAKQFVYPWETIVKISTPV